ncbi:MAG TPA: alcohol dehydrogenase, partial [Burkholderiaceae bacterium]|nr:alcohol dehydrogenase [Burkholderiaceae bacterium]
VLARVFGSDLRSAAARLEAFLDGLGVATRFDAYGVAADDAQRMIAQALGGVRGRNFIGTAAAT